MIYIPGLFTWQELRRARREMEEEVDQLRRVFVPDGKVYVWDGKDAMKVYDASEDGDAIPSNDSN